MLSLGNSVISIQLGQDIERSQNNNSPKQNKGLSFLDIKDIVESTVEVETKKEVKRDLIKGDVELKKLRLDREMQERVFLTMYKNRSATVSDLRLLTLDIHETQVALQDRLINEEDPDKQLHIRNELYILENLLEMIKDLTDRIIEAAKLSEENNRILSTTDGLRRYLEGSLDMVTHSFDTYYTRSSGISRFLVDELVYPKLINTQA